jgi:hypothetical protein
MMHCHLNPVLQVLTKPRDRRMISARNVTVIVCKMRFVTLLLISMSKLILPCPSILVYKSFELYLRYALGGRQKKKHQT